MTDTSFVGESVAMLAELHARLRVEEERRKRAARAAVAGVAVALVHVLFVALLIAAQLVPLPNTRRQKIEPLQWIILPQIGLNPKVTPVKPRKPQETGVVNPQIVPKFIRPPEEENNAITDFGLALGRSLACGANSYEYLNSKMRMECRHRPWQFAYDRYGNIVLDATPRVPKEDKPRTSDIQAHERGTADPCLIAKQSGTECIDKLIFGNH